MSEATEFTPDYIVVPGETITEMLNIQSMTQKELATRMGLSEKTVSALVKGNSPITQKHADSLEIILGLSSSFWLNLQRDYDDAMHRLQRDEELREQIDIAEQFPQETLKEMKLLPKGRNNGKALVEKLLGIFKVQNLHRVLDLYDVGYNCRISEVSIVDKYALATWMRLGELAAGKRLSFKDIPSFNAERVYSSLDKLRDINTETNPEIFLKKVEKTCYELGIVFVVVPEIKGSRISGMARWKKVGKRNIPMIQLSLRGKKHDMFWFTFFHELGHILLHAENDEVFVDLFEKGRKTDDLEDEADEFARETLIPSDKFNKFIERLSGSNVQRNSILSFSAELGIHPGIVVGRLQNENYIPWSYYHDLKVTYRWKYEA